MIPLYWIEGFQEYDREMFKSGFGKYSKLLVSIAKDHGLTIEYLNIADLFFGFSHTPHIYYRGEDILQNKACTCVPYSNPHPQTEHLLHSLSRIIASCTTWTQINVPLHLDRDKEQAYHLASLVGAQTIPSYLVPDRTTSRMHIGLIESKLGPYPYIVKPTSMLAGIGIMRIDNRDALLSVFDYCGQTTRTYMIQPFLEGAFDIRVYLENYEVIACQKRIPPKDGYLSNISQRGSGEIAQIDDQIHSYSKNLAKHLTDGYLCIDWLITDSGTYFSEIDFTGMFFGLPEPRRTQVIHAFFRSARKKFDYNK